MKLNNFKKQDSSLVEPKIYCEQVKFGLFLFIVVSFILNDFSKRKSPNLNRLQYIGPSILLTYRSPAVLRLFFLWVIWHGLVWGP
jgi:hypothetical protein